MTQKCDKCEGDMYKKQTLNMSNAVYEIFECTLCGKEKQICKGVK